MICKYLQCSTRTYQAEIIWNCLSGTMAKLEVVELFNMSKVLTSIPKHHKQASKQTHNCPDVLI